MEIPTRPPRWLPIIVGLVLIPTAILLWGFAIVGVLFAHSLLTTGFVLFEIGIWPSDDFASIFGIGLGIFCIAIGGVYVTPVIDQYNVEILILIVNGIAGFGLLMAGMYKLDLWSKEEPG